MLTIFDFCEHAGKEAFSTFPECHFEPDALSNPPTRGIMGSYSSIALIVLPIQGVPSRFRKLFEFELSLVVDTSEYSLRSSTKEKCDLLYFIFSYPNGLDDYEGSNLRLSTGNR